MTVSVGFSFTTEEYAAVMTEQTHATLGYLLRTGYIDNEAYNKLANTLIVTAIPHNKGFGRRILDRLFGKDGESAHTGWVFPITELPAWYQNYDEPTDDEDNAPSKGKPALEIVK